jgi:hypothetical protein
MNIEEMSRQEYIAWAKANAMECLKNGDTRSAFTSMASDLQKRPETREHPAIELGLKLMLIGKLTSVEEMKKFIEGFN